jgi:NADP-reducing hydrogenase subunit HndB
MNKVKTLDDLRKMRETLRSTLDIREKSNHPEQMVQIRISMATCGIAAGAKEIMNYFIEALDREKVDALVTQTGCMGYCYAEPTVEVTLPGKEPLVFGHVKKAKVDESGMGNCWTILSRSLTRLLNRNNKTSLNT